MICRENGAAGVPVSGELLTTRNEKVTKPAMAVYSAAIEPTENPQSRPLLLPRSETSAMPTIHPGRKGGRCHPEPPRFGAPSRPRDGAGGARDPRLSFASPARNCQAADNRPPNPQSIIPG